MIFQKNDNVMGTRISKIENGTDLLYDLILISKQKEGYDGEANGVCNDRGPNSIDDGCCSNANESVHEMCHDGQKIFLLGSSESEDLW